MKNLLMTLIFSFIVMFPLYAAASPDLEDVTMTMMDENDSSLTDAHAIDIPDSSHDNMPNNDDDSSHDSDEEHSEHDDDQDDAEDSEDSEDGGEIDEVDEVDEVEVENDEAPEMPESQPGA